MRIESKKFAELRRQQFLTEQMYQITKKNQSELILVSEKNLLSFCEGSNDYAGELEMVYLEKLWLWMLEYTAGCPIDEISPRFSEIVKDFVVWNEAFQSFAKQLAIEFPEDGAYRYMAAPDFENLADYQNTLQLFSIAILLRDRASLDAIVKVLRSHSGKDALFDELMEICGGPAASAYECILGMPYELLASACRKSDDSVIIKEIEDYLNAWYQAMAPHPRWYNAHLDNVSDGPAEYYGYWAFEAAAIAFVFDVDDSGLTNMVYPMDLADYARKSRSHEEKIKEGISGDSDRVEGGSICPRDGYWETPAAIASRAFFKAGDVMPIIADAEYGKSIWHWSIDQD